MFRILVAAVFASTALSQQTLVVDIAGGTPYQQIQAAIQAANPGDVIEVRPGVYAPIVCDKPLRIQGVPGVVVQESTTAVAVRITGIPAGTMCSLSAIKLASFTTPCICEPYIGVSSCDGVVVLDGISPDGRSLEPKLDCLDVVGLLARDCVLGPVNATRSELHFTDVFVGPGSTDRGALVRLSQSEFDMTDGFLRISYSGMPSYGIELQNNSRAFLRVVSGIQLSMNNNHFDFFVDGSSRVDYDPVTTFSPFGVATPWPFGTVGPSVATEMPAIDVTAAAPGGTVDIAMRYNVPSSFVLPSFAEPCSPLVIPEVDGALFLDPTTLSFLGVFPTGLGGITTVSRTVPNDPSLSGLVFAVQAAGLAGAQPLPATNADVLRIR